MESALMPPQHEKLATLTQGMDSKEIPLARLCSTSLAKVMSFLTLSSLVGTAFL